MILSVIANGQRRFVVNGFRYNTGPAYQAQTLAFVAKESSYASYTVTTTEKNYIDTIVRDWNGLVNPHYTTSNIWSKAKLIYPVVGSTANSHAINLADTGNYTITWNGTLTHANGTYKSNGTTGYGNSGFNPNGKLSTGQGCLVIYVKTLGTNAPSLDIGNYNGTNEDVLAVFSAAGGSGGAMTDASHPVSLTGSGTAGIWAVSATSSTSLKLYKAGVQQGSTITTTRTTTHANINYYLAAENDNPTASGFSDNTIGFVAVFDGLTDAEILLVYNSINLFNTGVGK